jgi:hypothetical protein
MNVAQDRVGIAEGDVLELPHQAIERIDVSLLRACDQALQIHLPRRRLLSSLSMDHGAIVGRKVYGGFRRPDSQQ